MAQDREDPSWRSPNRSPMTVQDFNGLPPVVQDFVSGVTGRMGKSLQGVLKPSPIVDQSQMMPIQFGSQQSSAPASPPPGEVVDFPPGPVTPFPSPGPSAGAPPQSAPQSAGLSQNLMAAMMQGAGGGQQMPPPQAQPQPGSPPPPPMSGMGGVAGGGGMQALMQAMRQKSGKPSYMLGGGGM